MLQLMPLFPLHTVLFPGGLLPLRIFETRYIDMVRAALRNDTPFGVVLLKQGSEVLSDEPGQPAAEFHRLGCTARIVDTDLAPDGMLHILCRGEQRFAADAVERAPDGLWRGQCTPLDAAAVCPTDSQLQRMQRLLSKLSSEDDPLHDTAAFEDPVWLIYRLIERLPIKLADRQRVLAADRLDLTLKHLSAMMAAFE
ncbi:LON peptidase substrate-binding domain-containing protein [Halothiobacillus sp. DCM-1]|uniref:LON peptidase substrate-binding domain-containing protein n=1 Tax=Halothiobacillus sp. DCM-1 TaxID=3112558 RepID=UPI0032537AFF